MASPDLIETLEQIGAIKDSLPLRSRGWCNELGLFVQLRELKGMASLKAGGRFRSRIELRRESAMEPWETRKYLPGDWEALAEPTLRLAAWLAERGGLAGSIQDEFRAAIDTFRNTGHLVLPDDQIIIPEEGDLRQRVDLDSKEAGYTGDTTDEVQFCAYVSGIGIRGVHHRGDQTGSAIEAVKTLKLMMFNLALGVTMARQYPEKATLVLIRERQPSPTGGLDTRRINQSLGRIKGEEGVFQGIQSDFKARFEVAEREDKGSSWIFGQVLSRLESVFFSESHLVDATIDEATAFEALFGATKDGIGFGLFLPRESLLQEFQQELKREYNRDTEGIDADLDRFLQAYENEFGVIR